MTLWPDRPLLLMGSCFSDNIGAKMQEASWRGVCVNPCGTLYNPASIATLLQLAMGGTEGRRRAVESSLTLRDSAWVSWLFSSRISGATSEEAAERCMEALDTLRKALEQSQALIITLGTAYVYYRDGRVVANCHKYPEREFTRRCLSVGDCRTILSDILQKLKDFNPELKVIITVSPVRHLRDGFVGNSRSKATLLLSIETEYFPAYEILNDDLRDYRFYADDLLHPSQAGISYIWEKFMETYISDEGKEMIREGKKRYRRGAHRKLI